MAACYLEQGRAKDFILDLLHLDVPRLFVTESDGNSSVSLTSDALAASVPDEFTNFLTDYIQRNSLGDDILEEVETIWVCDGCVMGVCGREQGRKGLYVKGNSSNISCCSLAGCNC